MAEWREAHSIQSIAWGKHLGKSEGFNGMDLPHVQVRMFASIVI